MTFIENEKYENAGKREWKRKERQNKGNKLTGKTKEDHRRIRLIDKVGGEAIR